MDMTAFGIVASALLFAASPAAAQQAPLEMRCQAYEAVGPAWLSYQGTFRASGIRATKVVSHSALTIPAVAVIPAGAARSDAGAPEMVFLYGDKGAVDFARFAVSFTAKPVLATAKVQLLRGKTVLAEIALDRGKVAALLDNRSLWIDFPAAASAKLDGAFTVTILDGARQPYRFDFSYDKQAMEKRAADYVVDGDSFFGRRPMVEGKIPERLLGVRETGCKKS